jgi:hypothetical protein
MTFPSKLGYDLQIWLERLLCITLVVVPENRLRSAARVRTARHAGF